MKAIGGINLTRKQTVVVCRGVRGIVSAGRYQWQKAGDAWRADGA